MKRILGIFLIFVFASADAALIDRGGGFIYDDVLDITWTQDANIRFGDGVLGLGLDTWDNQVAWAAGLSIVDTRPGAGGVTYSDWRLASVDVNGDDTIVGCSSSDTELACRDNEYRYLFIQNGVSSSTPGLFTNVQSFIYWSGTDGGNPTGAWTADFQSGAMTIDLKSASRYAWAVRDGDVAAVPVPAAAWLFGSAFGLLGWMRRKAA